MFQFSSGCLMIALRIPLFIAAKSVLVAVGSKIRTTCLEIVLNPEILSVHFNFQHELLMTSFSAMPLSFCCQRGRSKLQCCLPMTFL